MQTNILVAIKNLVKNPNMQIEGNLLAKNRVNSMGDGLEMYIKDLFCNSFSEKDLKNKIEKHEKYLAYSGNQNNPPDMILRRGDAIEVKKIESLRADIALNSSYPKDKLFADSPMIAATCRACEKWTEKDLIYIIGTVDKSFLKALWFVYGDCYAASKETYERIRGKISKGINELSDVEFSETNELGRVNKVDPLGITYFRIRGVWGIQNPEKVFSHVVSDSPAAKFSANVIIRKEKFLSFPENDRNEIRALIGKNFSINDVRIKSPNNPAKLLDAIHMSFIA